MSVNFAVQLNKEPEQYQYRISRIQVFTSMKYTLCHISQSPGPESWRNSVVWARVTIFYGTMTRKGSVIDHVTLISHCRHGLFL